MTFATPEKIREEVRRHSDAIIEWTKALVKFPSENRPPDGNELPVQAFIETECRNLGLDVDVFAPDEIPDIQKHPCWLAGRNYAGRKNVVARWKGKGSGKKLLLSGHVDVAPFEPDNWKICRPFNPVIKDGRLYGRGSADMKGGLAAAFWALRILKNLGVELSGDVMFESLVDEEFAGGNGTLAARLRGHNADLAVIPEPTRMQPCTACFGAFLGNLTLTGKGGMPYTGAAIANPVHGAARVVALFEDWQKQWRSGNSHPFFTDPGKELNVLLWQIDSNKPGEFTQMGTPLRVKISWIVWCHPGLTEEEFYRRFRAFWKDQAAKEPALAPFEMVLEPDFHYVKPWETSAEDPAIRTVLDALKAAGESAVPTGAPFSCDLALYGEVGKMPCLLLGPRGDNLHAPDEWVEIKDILALTEIFANLALKYCS
jgi:acetylornithine deacetylase